MKDIFFAAFFSASQFSALILIAFLLMAVRLRFSKSGSNAGGIGQLSVFLGLTLIALAFSGYAVEYFRIREISHGFDQSTYFEWEGKAVGLGMLYMASMLTSLPTGVALLLLGLTVFSTSSKKYVIAILVVGLCILVPATPHFGGILKAVASPYIQWHMWLYFIPTVAAWVLWLRGFLFAFGALNRSDESGKA